MTSNTTSSQSHSPMHILHDYWPRSSVYLVVAHLFAATCLALSGRAQLTTSQGRFEQNVRAYEVADQKEAPPNGAILLAGDSQFFRWKTLHEDLPGYVIVNRGIDSFQLSDLIHYADRLILPYKPRAIILHVGGNDVHTGKSPEQVLADFKTLVAKVRVSLPEVPIAFTSTTPSPARWKEAATRLQTNRLIQEYTGTQKNLYFIDLWDAMLTPDGQPREDIWVEDRTHPNHAGYLIRVKIMEPLLAKLNAAR